MLNRSESIRVAIAASFAAALFTNTGVFADNTSSLEQQSSITDGYSPANTDAGGGGAKAFAPADSSASLYQQLSDGDYAPNETAESESAYVGAKFEASGDDFVPAGLSITDGTTE